MIVVDRVRVTDRTHAKQSPASSQDRCCSTSPQKKFTWRIILRTGLTILVRSRSLAAISCSIGVKRKKFSRLTTVTSNRGVAKLLELQRCIKPAKAATENEDTGLVASHDSSRKRAILTRRALSKDAAPQRLYAKRSARAGAVRLTTMLGRDSRAACAADRRRKFPRCGRVQHDSDAR